jgi:7-cyano-7-deazaguanine synthase in queuosine biosynthesis
MKYELYETIEQSLLKRDGMELRLFTIDYGKRVTAAAIEWADAVISKLQKGDEL